MKRRIAVLFHEGQRTWRLNYVVNHYIDAWREDGHEVVLLFGVREFVPADIVLVHVDLTVVPEEYLAFAQRYPKVLNGKIRDIRKSTFSRLRVRQGEAVDGPVIAKSELNYAGVPERMLADPSAPRGRYVRSLRYPQDYRIFPRMDEVPPALWADSEVVIERFIPEMEDGLYVCRSMMFLGDRATCAKGLGPHPILNGTTQTRMEGVTPHPEMLQLRAEMGFDFGKFDYVMHDGRPVLLDANKTVGSATVKTTPDRIAARRFRADGINVYFDDSRA